MIGGMVMIISATIISVFYRLDFHGTYPYLMKYAQISIIMFL